jgi:glycerol kinase
VSARQVLAIDQGTTNTKAILIDRTGRAVSSASRPVAIEFPKPGWVEQDARALWRSVVEAAGECLERAGGARPAAIGISNQRESVVIWDRATGEPVGPCVVWQCRRTAPLCASLRDAGRGELLQQRTGLAIDPLFSASKARWLLDQAPDGARRAADGELAIGTVDSWLLWNLTGGRTHATDFTNASRTQLMDLRGLCWGDELLAVFGIPRVALPELRASSGDFGETAECGGIPAGIPIGALAGDSHAALFGHAAFAPGAVKATYGTGSSLMTATEEPVASRAGLSSTVGWSRPGQTMYALEGNITVTGSAVQWLGEFLGLSNPAADVAALAETVEDAGGVYVVPAFAGLGAPHWKDSARGLITGLTRGAGAAQVARATVESIAYQVRDVFDAMERDCGQELPALMADGGASRNDALMQFQADILNRPVKRSASPDVSALGAAWLAGLAVEVWGSLGELAAIPRPEEIFEPKMSESERANRYGGWLEVIGNHFAACGKG